MGEAIVFKFSRPTNDDSKPMGDKSAAKGSQGT